MTAEGGAGARGLDGSRARLERIAGAPAVPGGRSGEAMEVRSAVELDGGASRHRRRRS